MKISIGSDHRGVDVRLELGKRLTSAGHQVVDYGPVEEVSCDYPDVAAQVASDVAENRVERGILICGTGIGMAIAANKFPTVRAAVCNDAHSAKMSRLHNNANVLCLSGDMLKEEFFGAEAPQFNNVTGQDLESLTFLWLETEFEGGRHQRRIDKITELAT